MSRTLRTLLTILVIVTTSCGCSEQQPSEEHQLQRSAQPGSAPTSPSAKLAWDDVNAIVEETQAIVGGRWRAADTGARPCGADGAQWVITRLGPGASAGDRDEIIRKVDDLWRTRGWMPVRSDLEGDAPESRLRYPGGASFEDRFFVEIGMTVHGAGIQAQTPCAPGDADALNEEQYAYHHQTTTILPSASPTPGVRQ